MEMLKKCAVMMMVLIMGYVFVTTAAAVSFLMLLTYICIWPWNKQLYRKIVTHLAYIHWSQLTFAAQWWSGSTITVYMEDVKYLQTLGREHVIAMFNHKCDLDWLMSLVIAERLGMMGGTKAYGKSSIRFLPVAGWAMAFTESIFLKRDWNTDKLTITKKLKLFNEYPENYWVTLLLLCEGTRFTEEKHKVCLKVAKEKGLPHLRHHLLPRTKGFTLSLQTLKGIVPTVIDLTLGFRHEGAETRFIDLVMGKQCHAEIYVRRRSMSDIPSETEEKCADWLYNFYKEKDDIYDHFVQNGCYKMGTKVDLPRRLHDLVSFVTCGFMVWLPTIYYLNEFIMHPSTTFMLGAAVTTITVALLMRLISTMTETDKGSDYGKKRK